MLGSTAEPDRSPGSATACRRAVLGGVWPIYFWFGLTTASMAPLVAPIMSGPGINRSAMGAIPGA